MNLPLLIFVFLYILFLYLRHKKIVIDSNIITILLVLLYSPVNNKEVKDLTINLIIIDNIINLPIIFILYCNLYVSARFSPENK